MPNLHTSSGVPNAEPLELRLIRDFMAEHRAPALCQSRQCRRSRTCSGEAHLAAKPVALGDWLPPCLQNAPPQTRRGTLAFADDLRACIRPSREPHLWPADETAATDLRVLLAFLHRIHSRPGLHPETEIESLAAWAATDPDPAKSATCRRMVRHNKPNRRPVAKAEQPV